MGVLRTAFPENQTLSASKDAQTPINNVQLRLGASYIEEMAPCLNFRIKIWAVLFHSWCGIVKLFDVSIPGLRIGVETA